MNKEQKKNQTDLWRTVLYLQKKIYSQTVTSVARELIPFNLWADKVRPN